MARLLRHEGLSAQGEQRRAFGGKTGQADVLIDFDDYAVVIEAEFGDAAKADADKRLPEWGPVVVDGLPVRLVVAVGYPKNFAGLPERDADKNLAGCQDLVIAYRKFGEQWGENIVGSVTDLAEVLRDYWVQSDSGVGIEEVVRSADTAISTASEILSRVEVPEGGEQDGPATKALIWLNAMLFQELLARHLDVSSLPDEHRGKRILRPDPEKGPSDLVDQWIEILEINWWPIFYIAKETLKTTPAPANHEAVTVLKRAAAEIAETGAIRRHDVAGRIFHRLLDSRKFLATNYTTIPAAIMLAGLAFDDRSRCWSRVKFGDAKSVANLRVVDPACGSGTLLMAAAQEIMKRSQRASPDAGKQRLVVKSILENALYGFDVVPAAIHLAASTLCMAESRQLIKDMNLWRVQHDVSDGVARLGSLDFLAGSPSKGNAARLPILDEDFSVRVTGEGEVEDDISMPEKCHLVIANPPYTRAGGPGDRENTLWNPIFGSLLDAGDADTMKSALRKTLNGTPASLYAGLGSAFVVLAEENLAVGGRLAFVLPGILVTGSRWSKVRRFLLNNFRIDWVIASHDIRNRSAVKGLPGRRLVSFSESTRIAEVLVVATKTSQGPRRHTVQFVNLTRNPDEPVQAMTLMRKLLAMSEEEDSFDARAIDIGGTNWGGIISVRQRDLSDGSWSYAALAQAELVAVADSLVSGASDRLLPLPIREVKRLAELGPYHMQIKNPGQGLFRITESGENVRAGIQALWHHKAKVNTTLEAKPDARLERRSDRDRSVQDDMLARSGRLHIATELGLAPQRVAAVLTERPMLGVRSWATLSMRQPQPGKEEALCLWLNSTLGVLLRVLHGNRPYLGRSSLPHELVASLPVLDVDQLSQEQLSAAQSLYGELKTQELAGFSHLVDDPVRNALNDRFCREVLMVEPSVLLDVTARLGREPTMHARH